MKRKLLFAGLTMCIGLVIAFAVKADNKVAEFRCCNITWVKCYVNGQLAGTGPERLVPCSN